MVAMNNQDARLDNLLARCFPDHIVHLDPLEKKGAHGLLAIIKSKRYASDLHRPRRISKMPLPKNKDVFRLKRSMMASCRSGLILSRTCGTRTRTGAYYRTLGPSLKALGQLVRLSSCEFSETAPWSPWTRKILRRHCQGQNSEKGS